MLPIYVFEVTGSYVVTGVYASYSILISIVANLWWRNGFRREGRFTLAAVLGIVASSAVLLVRWDPPWDAFVFIGVYTLLSTPLNNMVTVDFMDRIDRSGDLDRTWVWADRELYLGIGRAVGLGATIVLATYLIRNPVDLILIVPLLTLYALSYVRLLSPEPPTVTKGSRPPVGTVDAGR